ncbi:MAG: PD40 domain-containing protein [Salinivirgaceae bacterium]|nr:PD40 domain-containing protein [Salinivirgaceae bacterium]
MRNLTINILAIIALASCSTKVENAAQTNIELGIYPDYKEVTIPCNIAPINFTISDSAKIDAILISCGGDTLTVKVSNNCTKIDINKWHNFLADKGGKTLTFTPCGKTDGKWLAYKPFNVEVSADSIDKTLVYRLIPPGYEIWNRMGIYQRDLETYNERAIYENRYGKGNCVNCHSFCANNSDQLMIHLRAGLAGTYVFSGNTASKVEGDFSKFNAGPTYPYWHPSGRFIAFSLNKIYQDFHTADPNIIEVYDDFSDVIVFDLENKAVISSPLTCSADAFETFPCFSPDGKWLYFCTSQAFDSVKWNYPNAHYSICRIGFDAEKKEFGTTVDTIVNSAAMGKSASFPRISPDGRFLLYTLSDYGNFSIWHHEADLKMIDLQTGDSIDTSPINSPLTESYHSWSSNSRWVVFSSRRGDGLYTRPYFAHLNTNGTFSKPMLLPQQNPQEYYQKLFFSYNIPELVKSEVDLSARITDRLIRGMQKK